MFSILFKSFNSYKGRYYDFFSDIFSNKIYTNLSISKNNGYQIKSTFKFNKYSFLLPKNLLIKENDPISPSFISNLNFTEINYDYHFSVANAIDIFCSKLKI